MKSNLVMDKNNSQNEMLEVIKYVESLKKNNIKLFNNLPVNVISDNENSVKYILNVINILKKYKPQSFILPTDMMWLELIMTKVDKKNNKDVLSQSLGEVNEISLITEIINYLRRSNKNIKINESCDLFLLSQISKNYDESKLDLIIDVDGSKINIEFKYLSRALLSLFWKTIWDSKNKDFNVISSNWQKELAYELIQADENFKKSVQKKLFSDLLKIKNVLLPYMGSNIEKLIEYIINKKFNQMKLFNESATNILYISIYSYIKKYELINLLFSEWVSSDKEIKIIINKEEKLNIENITFVYHKNGYSYANFELVETKVVDEKKCEYTYILKRNSNPLLLIENNY